MSTSGDVVPKLVRLSNSFLSLKLRIMSRVYFETKTAWI
uniref:Uncharacterized protein n=1 Tax=Anguilla anguilla TaxID=7936 RepID=A0A0E9T899_ANGAN